MRLFIGIYPNQEFLAYFRDVTRELDKQKRNLRFISLEQLHLTLRFIGPNVSLGSKIEIANALLKQAGQYPKPVINLTGLRLGVPGQHDPRVVIADVEENQDLDSLVNMMHRAIRQVGKKDTILWKTKVDHNYHISLARMKDSATRSTGREVKDIIREIDIPIPPAFQATEAYLVQSELTRRGPVYKKLEQIRF